MKVGIIGCGKIADKRAAFITKDELVGCFDISDEASDYISKKYNCKKYPDAESLIKDVDGVIISTSNDGLYENTMIAICEKKHVLVEKPASINSNQIMDLIRERKRNKVVVQVGFNHRFHPSFIDIQKIIRDGGIGSLMFIRANYGHGGRKGYDKEWRSKSSKGGGELLDQGVHLIDLSRWIFGEEFEKISGSVKNYFWDMEVEDNGFMTLETITEKIAFLNVSCTEWKNEFSFDIYGKTGKISVRGLGGSYGTESMTIYKMKPQMDMPDIERREYHTEYDNSWLKEWEKFKYKIFGNQYYAVPDLSDALSAMLIVEKIREMDSANKNTQTTTG